jgi:hypothetical protein
MSPFEKKIKEENENKKGRSKKKSSKLKWHFGTLPTST